LPLYPDQDNAEEDMIIDGIEHEPSERYEGGDNADEDSVEEGDKTQDMEEEEEENDQQTPDELEDIEMSI
jgi:hypothetical protein